MASVSPAAQLNQAKEVASKKQTFEMRKIENENEKEIKEVQEKSKKQLTTVKKDFEVQIKDQEQSGNKKLNEIRSSYTKKIDEHAVAKEADLMKV